MRVLVVTGGYHQATSFYTIFEGFGYDQDASIKRPGSSPGLHG